jgi:hypothetical protein
MSSHGIAGVRWFLVVVPLALYGCFTTGDDEDDGGDGSGGGCTADADCRLGRVCLDLDGNQDDVCDEGERCACGEPGSVGTGGSSNGGSSGSSNGGASNGGASNGGASNGGASNGGASNGGASNGGSATGGDATGGTSSGGSATGGSSGSPSACGPYCERLVEAMCAGTVEETCLTQCGELAAACPAELPALSTCVADPANTVACMAGQTVVQGCDAQIQATDRCLVCAPQTTDTMCQTCGKSNCCEPLADYNLAPDAEAFFTCASPCTTAECFDACVAMYPVAGAAIGEVIDCQNGSCAEPCICQADAEDTPCRACNKTSCCSEFVDYSLTADVAEFEECAIPCTTDACLDDCIAQFPEAGAAYGPWSECLDTNCLDVCSG